VSIFNYKLDLKDVEVNIRYKYANNHQNITSLNKIIIFGED